MTTTTGSPPITEAPEATPTPTGDPSATSGPPPRGPGSQAGPSSRRWALGALSIGLVAAACRSAEEAAPGPSNDPGAGPAADPTGDPTPGTTPVATATGAELERVVLPVAADPDSAVAQAAVVAAPAEVGTIGASPVAGATAVTTPDQASTATPPAAAATQAAPDGAGSTVLVVDVHGGVGSDMGGSGDMGERLSDPDEILDPESPSNRSSLPSPPAGNGGVARPAAPSVPSGPVTPTPIAAAPVLLANRITFGVTPATLTEIDRLGGGGYLNDQLARTTPDPAAEALLAGFTTLDLGANRAAWQAVKAASGQARLELTFSNLLRAVYSRHQLYEMMCQLWMDHFNVDLFGNGLARHLLADHQENVIRPNAMGSFRDLLVASANSPAMLHYLDNDTSNANSARGINENYGRELLELHTLGIDPSGRQVYDESDVRAASMAMTGWSTVQDRKASDYSAFVFRPDYQHIGPISLLGGAWTRGATTGKATGDSLLQFLVTHPSTARHVAWKICRRFISDTPSDALVASAAQVYLANDTELVPVLRHVLTSDEFADSAGRKLRRPFELLAASMRALAVESTTNPTANGLKRLHRSLQNLDHIPWMWAQPDGYPDTADHWLTTDGLSNRWHLTVGLARGGYAEVEPAIAGLRATLGQGTVGQAIVALGQRFGLGTRPASEVTAVAGLRDYTPATPAADLTDWQFAEIAAVLLTHPIFQTR